MKRSGLVSRAEWGLTRFTTPVFARFERLANKGLLHSNDWDRFYEFVVACHRYQIKRSDKQMRRTFQLAGFSEYWVDRMASAYEHGRGVLKVKGPC